MTTIAGPVTIDLDVEGHPVSYELGTSDDYGEFSDAAYGGNVYLTLNGRLYGSLFVHLNGAGEIILRLGQFDQATGQWEERNNIGPEQAD